MCLWLGYMRTKSDSNNRRVCFEASATSSGSGHGSGPASSNSTLRLGSSDSLVAATLPAEPPPTMITSYLSAIESPYSIVLDGIGPQLYGAGRNKDFRTRNDTKSLFHPSLDCHLEQSERSCIFPAPIMVSHRTIHTKLWPGRQALYATVA